MDSLHSTILIILLDFILSKRFGYSLQPRVILSSVNVYALKTRATYSCSADKAIGALWFLNGTESRELNLTNTTDFFFNTTNVGIFIFQYLTGIYNNTHIQCEALFPSEPPERSGNNKTLQIQGYLDQVGNLNFSLQEANLTLSWDASFTLDIPNIHPDIRYCVSIQFVEDVRDMSQMKCEIEETTFVYDFQSKPNGKYNVTVTPVNIVGEGAASSIQFSWRKKCPVIDDLVNGNVVTTGRTPRAKTIYECHKGFQLRGTATSYCLESGIWSGRYPECVVASHAVVSSGQDIHFFLLFCILYLLFTLLVQSN